MTSAAETRLAVYGTLAPGESNHHQLADLRGVWRSGTVRGTFDPKGFGKTGGYPGLTPDPAAGEARVQVFESADLPAHWARLDAFEGAAYRRMVVRVKTDDGEVEAYLYAVD